MGKDGDALRGQDPFTSYMSVRLSDFKEVSRRSVQLERHRDSRDGSIPLLKLLNRRTGVEKINSSSGFQNAETPILYWPTTVLLGSWNSRPLFHEPLRSEGDIWRLEHVVAFSTESNAVPRRGGLDARIKIQDRPTN